MNTVVTGGAGFIGSHLVRALLDVGHSVTVIDNLSTGRSENIPDEKSLHIDSLLNVHKLAAMFWGKDVIFHLAAIASVPRSVDDPLLTFQVNVNGTMNVLEAAARAGVKKVIFASSSSVYGNGSELMTEEDKPHPLSPYAISKLIGEQLCAAYTEIFSLQTVCLRYFNVYGEHQALSSQYGLAVPTFIDRASKNLPLPVYGSGEQTRDYVFVDDVVKATILSAVKEIIGVYNVGSGRSVSVNELAKTIIRLTGSNSVIEYHEPRKGDPLHTRANIDKITKEGFVPGWSLKEGLRRIIDGNRK